jgi:L,D-transpeptidase catalytic domain
MFHRPLPSRVAGLLAPLAVALVAVGPAVTSANAASTTPTVSAAQAAKPKPKPKPTTTIGATPTATTPAAPTPPVPTPKPKPAKASVKLYVFDTFVVSHQPVTVPNRTLEVGGVVRPFVAGQSVMVHAFLGRRLIKSDRLRVKPSRTGTYGAFTVKVASPGVGTLSIHVVHAKTDQMVGWQSSRQVSALDENIGFGSTGRFVELVQQRLAALHFYIPQTGVYDQGTGLALDAYHRMLGRGTSQDLDGATTTSLLDGVGTFRVRYPHDGTHAEGDLSDQLLALVKGSTVDAIYPISSGKPSTPTVLGHFSVYERTPGYLPDGMYYSDFFIGGYAIHGYDPAPDYPASHGCMRLPIVDAISAFHWLNYGDIVDVYYT